MSDFLRDRIASIIYHADGHTDKGWAERTADAVIGCIDMETRSETDNSQGLNQTDSLRDRIAAATAEAITTRPIPAGGYDQEDWLRLADAVIAVVQPDLEAEYNRGYTEGVEWLYDESRWIRADDE